MEKAFWEDKWAREEIGFHLPTVHPLLQRHWPRLELPPGKRVFLPLCGKTLDIGYLLEQGYQVVGAELSTKAIRSLFASLSCQPKVTPWAGGDCYRHGDLTVFQGDFFHLDQNTLEPVDAIYDRAALIALPDGLRDDYARHLMQLTDGAPQLLITLEYTQSQMPGPPFSVDDVQVSECYGDYYRIEPLSRKNIIEHEPGFRERGLDALYENAFSLTKL
ncbi:MAG: thiopurine S-methyltransferase [Pseudomonadales bacterium]|nr:thiopurine S-methyltransferase [Pseudomonadales bacterium]